MVEAQSVNLKNTHTHAQNTLNDSYFVSINKHQQPHDLNFGIIKKAEPLDHLFAHFLGKSFKEMTEVDSDHQKAVMMHVE